VTSVIDARRPAVGSSHRIHRTPIRVRMLGVFEVERADGSWVPGAAFRTAKTRQLLRLVALQEGAPVRVPLLIDLLWPDAPETRGRSSLRTAAAQIRRTLMSDHLVRQGDTLRLDSAACDVLELQQELDRAQRAFTAGDRRAALTLAGRAIDLYGNGLADDGLDLRPMTQLRDRLHLAVIELRLRAAVAALELDDPADALRWVGPVVDEDATLERGCRILMGAYARLGEVGQALRIYERCRRELADELGTDPTVHTRQVHQRLLQGATDLRSDLL
jgi:SARP family transcriptional regulator, regulator of embCAB operon